MVMLDSVRHVLNDQRQEMDALELGVEREALRTLPLDIPYAIILTGIRRCGKSTLLRQLARKVGSYAYLNLEDPRLAGFGSRDFVRFESLVREEYGVPEYILLDEVQAVPGWERFVRSGVDRGTKFVITGSNSSLLARELGTLLTGRHLRAELFPFSYGEFLRLREVGPGARSLDAYLQEGGFPSYLRYQHPDILRELFTDVVDRDVLARHSVREASTLRELASYLISNSGNESSLRSLTELFPLKSPTTAARFLSYLEDSYLLDSVSVYDPSFRRRLRNPRKIYAIDTGLATVNSTSFSEDQGRRLENAVFAHLRRCAGEVFYFRGKRECDFVVRERGRATSALQVCYELTEDNKERELQGLGEALERLELPEGRILTFDQEDTLQVGTRQVIVQPAWKWMAAEQPTASPSEPGQP